MTDKFSIVPCFEMMACNTTTPWTWAALAIGGYTGVGCESAMPATVPLDTFNGAVDLGTALTTTGALPSAPITPPRAPPVALPIPPMTPIPPTLGGASSFTILMSLGILVGACRPWSISDTIFTCLTTCAGGGGGGSSQAGKDGVRDRTEIGRA